jgi:CubicO group peptidase (beta-lactamase class C family)
MDRVARALEAWVAEGDVPSASMVVRVAGEERLHHTVGVARLAPRRAATPDQPYDLASVTKALAGSTVAAGLLQRGRLDLDDPVTRWLPDVDPRMRVHHLLEHSSGYPAWRPLYGEFAQRDWGSDATRDAILSLARRTPLAAAPGAAHTYSDLGFLVLLQVLEAAGDARLDALFAEHISDRVAVDLRWGWPGAAATEDCPVRGGVVEGEVHDLNCAAMGGVSAHAGLFGSARSVAELAEALLDATQGRRPELPGPALARMWSRRGPGSHRGGWDGVSTGYSSTGAHWPRDGVGHLGYTGTSVWMAPRQRVVVALLTNRVHPVDDKGPIRAGRPRLHDAVATALGWDTRPR